MALPDVLIVLAAASVTALGALWWLNLTAGRPAVAPPDIDDMSLLFEDGHLIHGSDSALTRFALAPGYHQWEDIREALLSRFPEFPAVPRHGATGNLTLAAEDGDSPPELRITWRDALCWLHLPQTRVAEEITQETFTKLAALRRASDSSPNPAWQTEASGRIIWHNRAYAALKRKAKTDPDSGGAALFSTPSPEHPNRVCLRNAEEGKPDWYALTTTTEDNVQVYHATCINAVVAAEEAQRNFVQTLAKTFAHLSIGLAIFDRNGQLALFNPALVDLTALPAPFLSARPTMVSFFDQLRESRRMPEPKNYKTWRQEIAEVISAATDGRYQETWSLENGQTYSIRGRPHPDGATAFLIEDITAEVTLTRNFRAELEQSQSLLDTLEDGFAVFSASGVLTFCNAAYRTQWKQDPDKSFAEITINDAIRVWQEMSATTPLWPDIAEFVLCRGDRDGWNMPIYPLKGAPLSCEVSAIASGATLVRFRPIPAGAACKDRSATPSESNRRQPSN
ncbi:PAS-domain containing protein [Sulfitobacter sp. W027]|uniref:PAS-domain containing protein n=1 Tax=Sulfitobacter sp. W027 TaxID=2867025 RepID=UPI0021A32100|nr:PAS-domain containing protein [Sulfitobacter sp. W027]UWR33617.1 PAS-domain containing protein [Sulfitobacter sp. W027]